MMESLAQYFNFKPLIGMAWASFGIALCQMTFLLPFSGLWNLAYAVAVVLYISTADFALSRLA
jgi:hypothetical protein